MGFTIVALVPHIAVYRREQQYLILPYTLISMVTHTLKRQIAAAMYIEITMLQLLSDVCACDITGKSVTLQNSYNYDSTLPSCSY